MQFTKASDECREILVYKEIKDCEGIIYNMQASAGMQAYEELVWRKGNERCERSYFPTVQASMQVPTVQASMQAPQIQAERQAQAPMQAPAHEEQRIAPDGFRHASNKREEASAKINERYLVGQATQNPFMPSNNYIQDIENQMNFLTPQKI